MTQPLFPLGDWVCGVETMNFFQKGKTKLYVKSDISVEGIGIFNIVLYSKIYNEINDLVYTISMLFSLMNC